MQLCVRLRQRLYRYECTIRTKMDLWNDETYIFSRTKR